MDPARGSKVTRLFACGAAFLLLPGIAPAQGRRLNSRFLPESVGGIEQFATSSDGTRVVYRADQVSDQVFELYSAPSDGSAAPVKLSGPMVAGGDVDSTFVDEVFRIGPDGSRVVYLADQDTNDVVELYSVPVDASAAPVKLSGTLAAGGDVWKFEVAPAGERVVYLANVLTNKPPELYSAPIDASAAPVKLNGPLMGGHVSDFRIAPDGTRAVFLADPGASYFYELFSAPTDGSPVRIDGPLVAGGSVIAFEISPDGRRVVYLADQDTNDVLELYSAPIAGDRTRTGRGRGIPPRSVKLNGRLVAGGNVSNPFLLSPDGARVVYRADQDQNDVFELYSVPIDRSTGPVKLNDPLVAEGDVDELDSETRAIDPQGTRVLFRIHEEGQYVYELYSAPLDGSASPAELEDPALGGVGPFEVAPDGGRVVFIAYSADLETTDLLSVPLDFGSAPRVLSTSVAGDYVYPFRVDPVSARVVYRVFHGSSPTAFSELFSVPVAGGSAPVKLHPPLATGPVLRDVDYFLHGPTGQRVVYLADQDTTGIPELYSVRGDGSGPPVRLNEPLIPGSWVLSTFRITADGARAVYVVTTNVGKSDLFSASLAGSGSPVRLHAPNPPGRSVFLFVVSPDGSRVVFIANLDPNNVELHSAPIDGSAAPVKLSGPMVAGGSVVYFANEDLQISSDSQRVVYLADQDTNDVYELYSVPIDGSASPVKLNGPLVAGGNLSVPGIGAPRFRISPDASRVVFRADQDADERFELYSVPGAGSAAPVKLNGQLVGSGNVIDFQFAPDGVRLVYRADQDANDVLELYRVRIDGSGGSKRVNAPFIGGGDASLYRVSPDSERVVYMADQATDEILERLSYLALPPRPAPPPGSSVTRSL